MTIKEEMQCRRAVLGSNIDRVDEILDFVEHLSGTHEDKKKMLDDFKHGNVSLSEDGIWWTVAQVMQPIPRFCGFQQDAGLEFVMPVNDVEVNRSSFGGRKPI